MKPSEWGRAQYVEAYEGGASIDDIAMVTGKAYSTIHYHLKKAGVTLRGHNRYWMEHENDEK